MLIVVVSAQRGQTIHLMNIHNMTKTDSIFSFTIPELTQTSKPGVLAKGIKLMAFTPDIRLCVYDCLNKYINAQIPFGQMMDNFLLVMLSLSRKGSRETVRRWPKHVMLLSGIDISLFKPHRTQAASTSAAKKAQQPIGEILKVARWKSDFTFAKFSNKPTRASSDYANTTLSN